MADWASNAIAEQAGAVAVAGRSRHFQNAMRHFSSGDLAAAERELFGPGGEELGGFTAELIDEKLEKSALNLRKHYFDALRRAR